MKMKWTMLIVVGLAFSASASVIIDGATNDGGFEDGAGAYISPWAAVGFNGTVDAGPSGSTVRSGEYAASIGTADGIALQGVHINTGHEVAVDDQFTLNFYWAARHGWVASEELSYRLFTTSDNTVDGVVNVLSSGVLSGKSGSWNSPGNTGEAWFGDEITNSFTVTSGNASIGQQLYVEFYATNVDGNSWARVDDVTLNVIPEPATIGLVAAAGGAMLFLRRRLMM